MKKREKKFIKELRENPVITSINDKTNNMLRKLDEKAEKEKKNQEPDRPGLK